MFFIKKDKDSKNVVEEALNLQQTTLKKKRLKFLKFKPRRCCNPLRFF